MTRLLMLISVLVTVILPASPARPVEPDEILSDPALERRARDISLNLRCLVCQNQSIDDSSAPLAKDLRVLVRERLSAGDNDAQVVDFIVERYGEFVLLKPRFAPHTLILWFAPPLLFLAGIFAMYRSYRRASQERHQRDATTLTAKEKRELKKLLEKT